MRFNNRLFPPPSFSGGKIQPLKKIFHIFPILPLSSSSFCEKGSDWYEHCRSLPTLFDQKAILEKKFPFRYPIFFRRERVHSNPNVLAVYTCRGGKVELNRKPPPRPDFKSDFPPIHVKIGHEKAKAKVRYVAVTTFRRHRADSKPRFLLFLWYIK